MDKNSDINKYILQNCIKRNVVNKKEKYAPIIDFVFAVSGAAALGKTAFCKNLERYLNDRQINTVHIPLDGFLLDRKTRRDRKLSGYNPESTDMPLLIETMKELIYDGREINLPLYDHRTGKHSGFKLIGHSKVIILDGIMSLHYEIRERFTNFNIFLYSDDLVMRGLRLLVDMEERGYSVFEALSHSDEEFASYNKWIYHQIFFANLRISVGKQRELGLGQK